MMETQVSVFNLEYEFGYESDWHMDSLLSFAQHTWATLSSKTRTEQAIRALVAKFIGAADAYYRKGIMLLEQDKSRNTPFERHKLIERIGEEWSRVMSLVSTSRLLPETDETFKALNCVIYRAWRDLNLDEQCQVAVLPHFGRHFELVTFRYAPETVVVGIPLPSLYCPWDWTMIWHEVAGIYVQTEAAKEPIEALLKEMKELPEEVWQNWRESYAKEMESLPMENGMPSQEVLRNWSEEFVEDAVGVLCLGNTMAEALSHILEQHYASDSNVAGGKTGDTLDRPSPDTPADAPISPVPAEEEEPPVETSVDLRHPPASLRVQVAQSLSYRMGLSDQNSKDKGASRLAEAISSRSEELTSRVFSRKDKREVSRVATYLQAGQSPSQADSIPAYILIPAALRVFQDAQVARKKAIGEHIRQVVHNRLRRHMAPASMTPLAATVVSKSPKPSSFQAELDGITTWQKWGDLLNLAFSETDSGTARESGSHSHGGLFGFGTLRIRYSGISTNHGPHSGVASHRHRH